MAEESMLDGRGRPESGRLDPLVFMPGDGYYGLSPRIAPGFGVGRRFLPGKGNDGNGRAS